jgi:hypothetical protein
MKRINKNLITLKRISSSILFLITSTFLIFFQFSCRYDSLKKTRKDSIKIKTRFILDRFENRNDTMKFHMDKGSLTGKEVTLKLCYAGIMCTCAQWNEYNKKQMELNEQYFLEPSNDSLVNADDLYDGELPLFIKVTGEFYTNKGYPKNYRPAKGDPDPAKVFRFVSIEKIEK